MALDIDTVFRDHIIKGDINSGANEPDKSEIRSLLRALTGGASNPSIVKQTKAALDLVTPASETYGGLVLNDSDATKNGYYYRDSAAWVKGRGFPDTFATLTSVGGTANAITASTEAGVDPAEVLCVLLSDPSGTNSSSTVTLALNGGTATSVKAASGSSLAIGDIIEGVGTLFFKSGSEWRQLFSSATGATFDHQGDYAGGTTYTEGQVVTGSDGKWYQLKNASATGDDPVGSVTGAWLEILAAGGVADGAVTEVKLATAVADKLNNPISVQSKGVDVASRKKLDILGSGFKATDDGGNDRVRVELVDQFVTPFDYGGVGDGVADDTAAFQDMWDDIKTTGGKVKFCGLTWRLDGEVNMRIDNASHLDKSFDVDAYGAVFDFSNNSDTGVVSAIKIGSDAGVMAEHAHYNWSGGQFKGPIAGITAPGESGAAAMNMTALDVKAAYNLHLKDIVLWGFLRGLAVEEVYTNLAENVVAYGNYIGIELRDNCTHGLWLRSGGRKGRYGMVLRPSTDTGSIYGQTFHNPLLEGNAVGGVHDTRNGLVSSISYYDPYLEGITRDGFRIGRAIDYDDATNTGANRLGKSEVLAWYGGVWSPMGAWGDPSQDAILFNDAGAGAGQPNRILLLNLPTGVSVGINSADCSSVTQLP